jgi:glycosyltransferase involved in cell wall biosynthesis
MNLLLVVGQFPQRSETFIYRKAVALAQRGHRVTVASRAAGDWSLFPDPRPSGLAVEVWPPDGGLRAPRRAITAILGGGRLGLRAPGAAAALIRRVRADPRTREPAHTHVLRHLPLLERRFDVVHFEFIAIASLYPLAGELTGAPVVISCRGTEAHTLGQRPPAEQAPLLDALRRADAIHCVSAEIADIIEGHVGSAARIFVNRPGVDTDALRPAPRRDAAGPLRLITTGRLVWQKGLDYLLAALAALAARGVDFHIDIIGDGELRNAMAFSIGDLGLDRQITLVGAVTSAEVIERMRAADVFVLSSHTEGISNAALEAMAVGLPIVTTAAGGMSEAVSDGVEGFVVPVRDSRALADRLAELARDPERRHAMGLAARARVVRDLSLARQAATFEQIYGELRGSAASSV